MVVRQKRNGKKSLGGSLKKILHRTKNIGTIHSSDVETQSARCKTPAAKRAEAQLPTCHGCLLHPPPLVDLARDLTISGFFLPGEGPSLFNWKNSPVAWGSGGFRTEASLAFSLGYFACARAESSTIVP
jgi:hypothetical protein